MKKRKLVILAAIVFMLALGVTAFACSQPWRNARLKVERKYNNGVYDKDRVTISLDKCSCNPVNNQLEVFVHAQYESGGNYYWYPVQPNYAYMIKTNTASVSTSIRKANVTYAEGRYCPVCGTDTADFWLERHITSWYHNGITYPGEGYGTTVRYY